MSVKSGGFQTALLAALLVVGAAHAAVRASLDTTAVGPGDSVQLSLQADRQTSEAPDLAPLSQDFDVLSTSRSSNVQIVNGSVSSQTQVLVTLVPKRSGQLAVPAITWGGEHSNPLSLTVAASGTGGKPGASIADKVFLETSVDDKEPFVQSAVNVTVRVYATDHLRVRM